MDELIQLLQSFGIDTDADTPDYSALTDEQLAELHSQVLALFVTVRGAEAPDLPALEEIAVVSEALVGEDNTRQEQAAADSERIEELVAAVRPSPAQMAQHRRPANTPTPDDYQVDSSTSFVAQAGERSGRSLRSLEVAELMRDTARGIDGFESSHARRRFSVARARTTYATGQQLGQDPVLNEERIRSLVASLQAEPDRGAALVAAGGLCAPASVRYDQDVEGDDSRPVRDALAPFDASRGAVRFIPPPSLADIDLAGSDAAVGVWTMEQDEAALNDAGTRKSIQRITCGDEQTVEVTAVTKRLLIGNALGRTNPERVAAYIHLVGVAHARLAEQLLLARMKAGSVQLQEDLQVLGSFRDLAAVWVKAAWGLRNRHRIRQDVPLRLIAPDAIVPHSKIDLARQLPGANHAEVVSDAEIRGMFEEAGVRLTLSPDMPAHLAPAQVAGAQLVDLPSPIEWSLQVEGTWGFLDGGTLDLGFEAGTPLRDSDRLAANDYELFAETFERAVKFGAIESLWGRTVVCPTGEVAGTVDVTCDTAS